MVEGALWRTTAIIRNEFTCSMSGRLTRPCTGTQSPKPAIRLQDPFPGDEF
jgi:hypothetical protein